MGNNPRATIPEDATSGKTNMCKKFKIMNSDENMHLYIYQIWKVAEKSTVIIYMFYVMCNTYRFQ